MEDNVLHVISKLPYVKLHAFVKSYLYYTLRTLSRSHCQPRKVVTVAYTGCGRFRLRDSNCRASTRVTNKV